MPCMRACLPRANRPNRVPYRTDSSIELLSESWAYQERTKSAPRANHERTKSVPRAHQERTMSAPRPHQERTTSILLPHQHSTVTVPHHTYFNFFWTDTVHTCIQYIYIIICIQMYMCTHMVCCHTLSSCVSSTHDHSLSLSSLSLSICLSVSLSLFLSQCI